MSFRPCGGCRRASACDRDGRCFLDACRAGTAVRPVVRGLPEVLPRVEHVSLLVGRSTKKKLTEKQIAESLDPGAHIPSLAARFGVSREALYRYRRLGRAA